MIAVHGQYQIIALPILGEIRLRVINDMICTKRTDQVHIVCAAHSRDFYSECFGKLHGKGSYTPAGAMNQNLLAGLNLSSISQTLKRGEGCYRDGSGCLESQRGWFHYYGVFTRTRIFGKRAQPPPKDFITDLKLCDSPADRLHSSRQVNAESLIFWFEQPIARADQERFPSQAMPVKCIDGGRRYFYQDLMIFREWFFYLFELKGVRCPVAGE
jgi:hypothetical protein